MDSVLLSFLDFPGAWTGGKNNDPKLISPSPKEKKKKMSVNHVKERKLVGVLISSFQESFHIQEFPTGNIVSKCKAPIFCKGSWKGPLRRLIPGKVVTEAAMDGETQLWS